MENSGKCGSWISKVQICVQRCVGQPPVGMFTLQPLCTIYAKLLPVATLLSKPLPSIEPSICLNRCWVSLIGKEEATFRHILYNVHSVCTVKRRKISIFVNYYLLNFVNGVIIFNYISEKLNFKNKFCHMKIFSDAKLSDYFWIYLPLLWFVLEMLFFVPSVGLYSTGFWRFSPL